MAIPKRYRKDYEGEFVIVNTIFRNGKKEQEREWVENPVTNKHISGRATCIVDGISIKGFLLSVLEEHYGGLGGSLSMQVYGAQEIYKKMKCDFLVATGEIVSEVVQSGYCKDNIVYATARSCIRNPEIFYLIPHGIRIHPYATAVWLSCFDEHEEVFLFGYDEYIENGERQNKLIRDVKLVMEAYPNVKFYQVIKLGKMPKEWKYLHNIEKMSVTEFVSYTDT